MILQEKTKSGFGSSFLAATALCLTMLSGCRNGEVSKNGDHPVGQNAFAYYKMKYAGAILHFQSPRDSLKLRALYFILQYLDDQFFFRGKQIDEYESAILKSNRGPYS